jgi:hypothetical protein
MIEQPPHLDARLSSCQARLIHDLGRREPAALTGHLDKETIIGAIGVIETPKIVIFRAFTFGNDIEDSVSSTSG